MYRATRWDEAVVLKVLDPQQTGARERARFEREMATLRGLEHPRIERCFDHGVVRDADSVFDGQPYGVLEYIEGESLAQRRARGHLPLDEVLAIAHQLFEALEYLHTRPDGPVVHRDIKPGNLMWTPPSPDTPGALSLIDFGTVKRQATPQRNSDEFTLTHTNEVLGTLRYLPPEAIGESAQVPPPEPSWDMWAAGVTLYDLATEVPSGRIMINQDPKGAPVELVPLLEGLLRVDAGGRLAAGEAGRVAAGMGRDGRQSTPAS